MNIVRAYLRPQTSDLRPQTHGLGPPCEGGRASEASQEGVGQRIAPTSIATLRCQACGDAPL